MIQIIDYGLGNIGSVVNMFRKAGFESSIINNPEELSEKSKLVLPGVGSFDYGMKRLVSLGFKERLNNLVAINKSPILGICLGAQLMTKCSEEGIIPGLGWFDATTIKFNTTKLQKLKIPHMGWNDTFFIKENKLIKSNEDIKRYYYVHSYHFKTDNENEVLCKSNYGYEFVSGLNKQNIYSLQFHPEKSHKFGLEIFKNFGKL